MKKDTEKQPIDDLFARKLSQMSLPASPDGFERLQKRMNLDKPEGKVVLGWNQTFYRYMTAAACLGLVSLFGWLYWHSGAQTVSERAQVATNYPLTQQPPKSVENQASSIISNKQKNTSQLPLAEETAVNRKKSPAKSQVDKTRKPKLELLPSSAIHSDPVLTQVEPAKAKSRLEDTRAQNTPQTDHLSTEQGADSPATVKPSTVAERVLIVTIEEPTSLIAARQKARDFLEEKAALTVSDKAEKDTKRGVWQQVKRFKEGELLAHRGEGGTDEQGLLDRAYHGLKHSFDKNKPTKQ